jgi:hypothetical protein
VRYLYFEYSHVTIHLQLVLIGSGWNYEYMQIDEWTGDIKVLMFILAAYSARIFSVAYAVDLVIIVGLTEHRTKRIKQIWYLFSLRHSSWGISSLRAGKIQQSR